MTRPRRRFDPKRRRQPLAAWGFLRPHDRKLEHDAQALERLRRNPRLWREYRQSLVFELVILGALSLSCLVLLVQSLAMVRRFEKIAGLSGLAWLLPVVVAFLGWAALRRFLRVLADFRNSKP